MVGIGVVEDARGRAHFGLHGDDLADQAVGRAHGVGFEYLVMLKKMLLGEKLSRTC